jgi:hypothetical protein
VDVEKTIEFILDQQARLEVMQQKSQEMHQVSEAMHAKSAAMHEKTEATLRRAIALGVREARNERQHRRELGEAFDQKMTQLAAAQLITEERFELLGQKLDNLTDALRRGTNGHS